MAPVTFFRNTDSPVQPYYIAPWAEEDTSQIDDPILIPLRGDFFCMPFGANTGDEHGETTHGTVAGEQWTLFDVVHDGDLARIRMAMDSIRERWSVTRELMLAPGESVVYSRTTIRGGAGVMPVGHHATLAPSKSGLRITTSALAFGMTGPRVDPYTGDGEYYAHPALTEFASLEQIPSIWKAEPTIDRSTFPSRRGFVDILGVFPLPGLDFAWTAASAAGEGYVWFAVRDPKLLPATLLWMEDHGRHSAPWSGRNCCIGLEDVCGYFAEGLPSSAEENVLTQRGIPTAIELSDTEPTVIPYIQGVARVDRGFGAVASIDAGGDGLILTGVSGQSVSVVAQVGFLSTGEL